MVNFFTRRLLMCVVAFNTIAAMAQDIHFSQFTQAPLCRNPAFAGIVNGDIRVQSVFRSQWNSVANAYKTASLNAEYKMQVGNLNDFVTAGIQLFQDRAGTIDMNTTHVLPALNYHKSLSNVRSMYLSVAFMGGLVQRRFDRSKMTTNSQYEGRGDGERITKARYSYLDGSAGLSLNANFGQRPENNLLIGAAYHHFNQPKNSFYRENNIILKPKYIFSAGIKFGVTEMTTLALEADHMMQGTYQETLAGILYGLKIGNDFERPDYILHGGAYLRWNDALIPTIKLDYSPLTFALSYDVNISKLRTSTYGRGGFELSVAYVGFLNRGNSSIDKTICPRF